MDDRAGRAVGLLDVRYPASEMEGDIRAAVEKITGREYVPGVTTSAVETSFRPVWDRPEAGSGLVELVEGLTGKKQDVIDRSRLGTGDSNWFGAAGVPTLEGLGARGFDEYTRKERILLDTLFDRILLLARLIPAVHAAYPA